MKRTQVVVISFIFTIAWFIPGSFSSAQDATSTPPLSDLQELLNQLKEQVTLLQTKIDELKTQQSISKEEFKELKDSYKFIRTLRQGARGEDVRVLQEFLKQFTDIYPEGLVTSYFGPLTEAAVKRFQIKNGIVSSGTPETTGYGQVGPLTRTALNDNIGDYTVDILEDDGETTVTISEGATTDTSVGATTQETAVTADADTSTTTTVITDTTTDTATSTSTTTDTSTTTSPTGSGSGSGSGSTGSTDMGSTDTGTTDVGDTSSPSPIIWSEIHVNQEGYAPDIVSNGSGYGVVWGTARLNDDRGEVYFAILDADGNKIGSNILISDGLGRSRKPSISWNGSEYAVVWDGGSSKLYFTRIDTNGQKIDNDKIITSTGFRQARSTIIWTGSNYGVIWVGMSCSGGCQVRFVTLDSDGSKLSNEIVVNDSPSGNSSTPSLVWNGSEYAVTWYHPSGESSVYFRRINASGSKIGNELLLTDIPLTDPDTAVGWSGTNYFVVWNADKGGKELLTYSKISSSGQLIKTSFFEDIESPSSLRLIGNGYGLVTTRPFYMYEFNLNDSDTLSNMGIQISMTEDNTSAILNAGKYAVVWEKTTSGGIYFSAELDQPDEGSGDTSTTTLPTDDGGDTGGGDTGTTTPPGDTTPPVISSTQATNITETSATITWTTDEASDSKVDHATTPSASSPTQATDATLTTSHTINLINLTADTTYYYTVSSTDEAGNTTISEEQSFATMAPPVSSSSHSVQLSGSQFLSRSGNKLNELDFDTQKYTIEVWANLSSLTDQVALVSIEDGNQNNINNDVFSFHIDPQNAILGMAVISDPPTGGQAKDHRYQATTLNVSPINTWNHYAVTWSQGGSNNFYVNGESVGINGGGSAPSYINKSNSADLIIGARESGIRSFFHGNIDEVRIWNVQRSEQQIADNYKNELVGSEPGLIGYWQFENDLNDLTSNGNHLTNNGGATFSSDTPYLNASVSKNTLMNNLASALESLNQLLLQLRNQF